MSHLRAELDRLKRYDLEQHEDAARRCDDEGNNQQATWHRLQVVRLESELEAGSQDGAAIEQVGQDGR